MMRKTAVTAVTAIAALGVLIGSAEQIPYRPRPHTTIFVQIL